MHIDTSIILKQKRSIIHSKIIQKHLILLGYEFPKTKLAFALYGFSMQTIYFVKDLPKPHHGRGCCTVGTLDSVKTSPLRPWTYGDPEMAVN